MLAPNTEPNTYGPLCQKIYIDTGDGELHTVEMPVMFLQSSAALILPLLALNNERVNAVLRQLGVSIKDVAGEELV